MNQPDMFTADRVVARARARAERDKGMTRAADHADRVAAEWQAKAYAALQAYLPTVPAEGFTSGDFRRHASVHVPAPPDERAYGQIIMRAAKAGLIRRGGYTTHPDPSRHGAPAALWVVVRES